MKNWLIISVTLLSITSFKTNIVLAQEEVSPEAENVILEGTTCTTGSEDGINTAIGCIPLSAEGMAGYFLARGIAIAGGIAFLLSVYGGYVIMTSQGDPGRMESGKSLLTAAISGLLLLIFSVFIIRLLGFQILNIF
ncbi:MAG: hypothetical protein UV74_C0001G0091 [Candidatus Woesebacteria bacterium GW2011_GWB1_43_14]|uniref:Uncharacterized protein n=1 Tax=Candidatus Woesebacteria bacterium GW2011_GWB1_43_14 TaxID=1618578 RepID=A0A0G1FVF8_9BACT|nr:MAG: hypothetical protein UV51_C0002G0080 [Candidatus Woesebacteria bacterium GW2011_GWC1_42_9]KKS98981.1 MAG: hypothetical protein UV74_C0001G0091 [Candidatus Woesebacteria bacterium GW2011_GWB1_43_14]